MASFTRHVYGALIHDSVPFVMLPVSSRVAMYMLQNVFGHSTLGFTRVVCGDCADNRVVLPHVGQHGLLGDANR